MITPPSVLLFLLLGSATVLLGAGAGNCGCACVTGKETGCCKLAAAAPAKSHPLRGVIVFVDIEHDELTVKHEAIPGVMRAMTMVFKVDPPALKTLQPGQTITARMSRIADQWWLHEIKVVTE